MTRGRALIVDGIDPLMTCLGFNPGVFNENTNGVPDGVDAAQQLSSAVDALQGNHRLQPCL